MRDHGPTGSSDEFRFQVIPAGSISCNAVVLWHELTRDAVIIDPTDDAKPVIDFARKRELHVRQILLTHAHFDHAADAERAMTEFACPAWLHADDFSLYLDIPNHSQRFGLNVSKRTLELAQVKDNQTLKDLPDYPIEVMHVPGHSAGSVAFYVPRAKTAFVGDTLFNGGVGRTDLPGGSYAMLATSIQTRLYGLPDGTMVIPGHGAATTIGQEKHNNPFFRAPHIEPTL